jgi:hypothetical protein
MLIYLFFSLINVKRVFSLFSIHIKYMSFENLWTCYFFSCRCSLFDSPWFCFINVISNFGLYHVKLYHTYRIFYICLKEIWAIDISWLKNSRPFMTDILKRKFYDPIIYMKAEKAYPFHRYLYIYLYIRNRGSTLFSKVKGPGLFSFQSGSLRKSLFFQ